MTKPASRGATAIKTPEIEHFYAMTHVVDNRSNSCEVFGNHVEDPFPKFPRKWYFVDNGEGARVPHVLERDNTLKRKTADELFRDVSEYCRFCDISSAQYHWNAKKLKDVTQFILAKSSNFLMVEDIKILAWKSEEALTLNRMAFDRLHIGQVDPYDYIKANCPVFAEFLDRFRDQQQARAFLAFVGSILCDHNNRTQRGLILYGEGKNGKSTFLRMLDKAMGDAIRMKECAKAGQKNPFNSDGIERARVVIYADVEDKNLFTDPMIKAVIGGDRMEINRKMVAQFMVRPRAKVIACTNKMPNIRDSVAETRRWVFCEIEKYEGDEREDYQELFNAEMIHVLSACASAYESPAYMFGADIRVNPEAMGEVTAVADSTVEWFVKKYFTIGEDYRIAGRELPPLIAGSKARLDIERVIRYMRKNCGLSRSMTIKKDGETCRGYKGAKLNELAMNVACLTSTEQATSDSVPWDI